jgi:hypothetical protein
VIQTMEGSLAEVEAEIARLNSELSTKSKIFEQEKKDSDAKLEAEVAKSLNLQLKTCQTSLIILKAKLMLLMKS